MNTIAPSGSRTGLLAAMLAPYRTAREMQEKRRSTRRRPSWHLGHVMWILGAEEDVSGAHALVELAPARARESSGEVDPANDQAWFLLEGEVGFCIGGQAVHVRPGEYVWIPRGVRHELSLTNGRVRALWFVSAAGFEDYFRQKQRAAVSDLPSAGCASASRKRDEQAVRAAIDFAPAA